MNVHYRTHNVCTPAFERVVVAWEIDNSWLFIIKGTDLQNLVSEYVSNIMAVKSAIAWSSEVPYYSQYAVST